MFSGNVRRIATVLTASDHATGSLRSAESAGDDVAESMDEAEQSTAKLRNRFLGLAGATAALAGTLRGLTRQHGPTEQTFARLEVVAGATSEEMQRMQSTAQAMGRDLPIAMQDAADAMEQLAFAGFQAEEAVRAARGVGELAVASNMNMAEAARTTSSALRMFGLEADQTVQVTGAMAATFSSSATTIRELGQALEYVGPTANAAGVSLQEVSAAVGVLADRGIRASRAGTALNTTLQRIISGSGQAESALDRLNLSVEEFTNSEGEVQDLADVLATIGDRMDDLESDAERMQVATELAGRRGARALLPLLENTEDLNEKMGQIFRSEIRESIGELNQLADDELANVEEALDMDVDRESFAPEDLVRGLEQMHQQGASVNEMARRLSIGLGISEQAARSLAQDVADASVSTEQLAESIGGATTASEIAASQMDTTAGMVEFMRSSFDAMTFTIFKGAAPAISWFNEKLARGINLLNNHEGAMMAVGGTLAALTAVLGGAAAYFGLAYAKAALLGPLMTKLGGTFLGSAASAGSLSGALGILSKGLYALAIPAAKIIAVIAVIATVLYGLYYLIDNNVLGIGEDLAWMFNLIGGALGWLAPIAKEVGLILFELVKIIGVFLAAISIGPIIMLIKALRLLFDSDYGVDEFLGDFSIIGDFFEGLAASILGIDWAGIGLSLLEGLAKGILMGALLLPMALLVGLKKLMEFLPGPDADRGPLSNLSEIGPKIPLMIAGGIIDKASALFGAGLEIAMSLIKGLDEMGPAKYAIPILGPILAAKDMIANPDRWISLGVGILESIVGGLDRFGPAKYAVPILGPLLLAKDILTDPRRWIDAGMSVVRTIVDGIKNLADSPVQTIKTIVGNMLDFITSPDQWFEAGNKIVSTITDGIKDIAGSPVDAVKDIAGGVRDSLPFSDAKEGPLSDITDTGPALVKSIVSGIEQKGPEVKRTLQSVLATADGILESGFDANVAKSLAGNGKFAKAIGGSGPGATAAAGTMLVQLTLEQSVSIDADRLDPERIREIAEDATRDGGEAALRELELMIKNAVDIQP